jgi:hypothetical protein
MLFWSKCVAVAGAVSYAGFHWCVFHGLADADLRTASGVVAQIGATMLGFILAALAILATVVNTKLVRNMQRTGHYQLLLRRMFVCVLAFGFVTLAGIAVLFVPKVETTYAYLLAAVGLFALTLLADVSRKFWIVLHHLHPSQA